MVMMPTIDNLVMLADILQVKIDDLLVIESSVQLQDIRRAAHKDRRQ